MEEELKAKERRIAKMNNCSLQEARKLRLDKTGESLVFFAKSVITQPTN